jgi:hypothetical protein
MRVCLIGYNLLKNVLKLFKSAFLSAALCLPASTVTFHLDDCLSVLSLEFTALHHITFSRLGLLRFLFVL